MLLRSKPLQICALGNVALQLKKRGSPTSRLRRFFPTPVYVSGTRHLPDDDLDRRSGPDLVFLEATLDAPPQLSCDRVLFARTHLDQHQVVDLITMHPLNAGNLRR